MKKTVKAKRRSLALSHKSFTGKKLPKKYTSYPILLFILLCIGVLMASMTFQTKAADVTVTATADGPPPPAPAIITSPTEGDVFKTEPITVKGTCPAGFMVKLYRNNFFSGAVLCTSGDTFELQTDLFPGENLLKARIFNAIDEEGPASPGIHVFYKPPTPATGPTPTAAPSSPEVPQTPTDANTLPLLIKVENLFKGYYTGDTIDWHLEITGGKAPYAVSVDWGDGETSVISRKTEGPFNIRHMYHEGGGYKDSYVIKIRATDFASETTFLQLMVIVKDRAELASFATPGSTSGLLPPDFSFKYLWPLYGMTLAMIVSFWLGERRQYLKLHPRLKQAK